MKKIVGIIGYRQVGKSTARSHLVENRGFVHRPFAGPLKNMLRTLGLSETELDGDMKEEPSELLLGRTPRYAMQTLGTEWARNLMHPDFWITAWRRSISHITQPVVADDVRFINEAAMLRDAGGYLIRLRRAGCGASNHQSETELDSIRPDFELHNDGTPEELAAAMDELLR